MRSEADVLGALELPVLALVPLVKTEADLRRERQRRLLMGATAALVCVATGALFWVLKLWQFIL
jgi:uncharacterized protein YybS (DUF2232 family)